ncbi:hypothetical protein DL98DRAFT_578893 [Cadophora sp. DSE1049]|nr:hypothetical protein DL98DRAFT_578893 [Cadophora sp. DSE1049]
MNNSSSSPLSAALSHLRTGDTTIATFQDPEGRVFSNNDTTKVDIFEVRNGRSSVYRDLDDIEFRKHLKDDSVKSPGSRRLRIIMLDGDEDDAERLPIAPNTLKLIFEKYDIAPRFAFYLSRQQMASGSTHFDASTQEPTRHASSEFWWSAVVRAPAKDTLNPDPDNSRRVMNWLRCCVWADFDAKTGSSTVLAFRYPVWMKEAFFSEFADEKGAVLEQHPMMFHATCLERLSQKQDYEIFLATAKSLRKQNAALAALLHKFSQSISNENDQASKHEPPNLELQNQLDVSFQQVRKELKLGKVYLTLYLERCMSGIQDTEALSTRYFAELDIETIR